MIWNIFYPAVPILSRQSLKGSATPSVLHLVYFPRFEGSL
jgi:hypothetical protein